MWVSLPIPGEWRRRLKTPCPPASRFDQDAAFARRDCPAEGRLDTSRVERACRGSCAAEAHNRDHGLLRGKRGPMCRRRPGSCPSLRLGMGRSSRLDPRHRRVTAASLPVPVPPCGDARIVESVDRPRLGSSGESSCLGQAFGSARRNVEPRPGPALSAQARPPIASASARAMASPMPDPPRARERDGSTR